MQLICNFLFFLFSLFYLPFFFLKGKHRQGFGERLGMVPAEVKRRLAGKKVLWVHAVSVGEVVQAARLIDVLRPKFPSALFVLTTTTATGYQTACRLKKPQDQLLYFPIDFGFCVHSFVRDIRPSAVVILETEIWPNLIWELSKKHIPVFIVNGRISDRALRRYRFFVFFFKPLLNLFQAIAVQDGQMGSRFLELGASPARVVVTGSMKYDWQPPPQKTSVEKGNSFLWVAGSTHEGEEEILIDCYFSLRKKFPALRLLIAPRHLDRLGSIERKISQKGLTMIKTSTHDSPLATDGESIFVLDQMGVLVDWYRTADVVFVGGSLVPAGGHNLVEPAFFEKPILFGPHTHNFREMVREFKEKNAGLEIQNKEELERALMSLIQDADKRHALGAAAKALILSHQGASQKNAELIAKTVVK
jgi:3-deoxy-D-manno-octulosonic-acid transferase